METDKIIQGDCIEVLKTLQDGIVNTCITSPPYFGLRDYGMDGQIGLEETPDSYVQKLVEVFREVRRVLRDDGTLWLNLGDSYAGSGRGPTGENGLGNQQKRQGFDSPKVVIPGGLKPKDLIGIPWRVAFALQADGWYLRQDIIWHKPNPMPESVTDRCTKAHEYIFLLSKSQRYYYDNEAIKEPVADSTVQRLSQDIDNQKGSSRVPGKTNGPMKAVRYGGNKYTQDPTVFNRTKSGNAYDFREVRNKRSVWTVATKPFSEAHFATFPEELISPCVLAGCPEGGLVYDPFMGAGTTSYVAKKLGRHFLGSELNPAYIEIANRRINSIEESLFL